MNGDLVISSNAAAYKCDYLINGVFFLVHSINCIGP